MNIPINSIANLRQGLDHEDEEPGYTSTIHDLAGSPERHVYSADASTDRSDIISSTGSYHLHPRSEDLEADAAPSTDITGGGSSNLRLFLTGSQSQSSNSSAQEVQAFKSYISNVDYVKNQQNYLSENRNNANHQEAIDHNSEDHQLLAADSIPGYTLLSQFEAHVERTTLLYKAVNNTTNEPVLVRISPLIETSSSMVRILTEWYLLSGRNPPTKHRLWNNDMVENEFLKPNSRPRLGNKNAERLLTQPITLPFGIDGIIYPIDVVNVVGASEQGESRRMALVYPDKEYLSLQEYHNNSGSGSNSLFDPTIDVFNTNTAGLSSISIGASSTSNKRLLTSGRLAFEELYNKIRQSPQLPLKIVEVLGDMISVVKTLKVVHELGVVHNGLTSQCLFKNKDGQMEISGWDFSFSVQPEDCANGYRKRNLTNLMALLPYISPESTGDLNKRVSYKSDFYSLGVILYEMTVGVLPFAAKDAAALIRMHLFQKPAAPALLAPSWISNQLSNLIMKLLEKEDTKRPSSANEVILALMLTRNHYIDEIRKGGEAIRDYLAQNENTSRFLIKDEIEEILPVPPVFVLPEAVYGRNEEYRKIFTTTEYLTEGESVVIISAPPGFGKSTLLGDLRTSSISKTTFHCSWKFSKSDTNTSVYTIFISAMSSIVKQILKSSKENIDKWRDLIVTEIPLDLGILFYLIPELNQLLGRKYSMLHREKARPDIKDTTSDEPSEDSDGPYFVLGSRFHGEHYNTFSVELKYRYIVKAFLALISIDGLTIFLDDIQWCSAGEISLLAEIIKFVQTQNISTESDGYFKIIATMDSTILKTYDTNMETSEDTLAELFKISGAKVFEFELKEISKQSFSHFLQSSLVVDSPFSFGHEVASFGKDESTSISSMFGDNVSFLSNGKTKDEKVDSLSLFLYHHLKGNVLLAKYVLKTAFLEGKIEYRVNRYNRRWDFEYTDFKIPTNPADIISNYLSLSLSPEAMSLMKFAAITTEGHYFRLSELMIVSNLGIKEVHETINLCVETGVITPSGPYYKLPFHLMADSDFPVELTDLEIWKLASETYFKFDHDSIQSAIISNLVQLNELEEHHRICALRYYKKLRKETNYPISTYLTMGSHFAKSWKIVKSEDSSTYLSVLIKAGRLAMGTYNLGSSLMFFEAADHFIRELNIKHKLRNRMTMCQVHYYLGNYKDCLNIIDDSEAKYGLDKTRFVIFRARSLIKLGRLDEGIKVAVESLEYLGIDVDADADASNGGKNDRLSGQIPQTALEIRAMKNLPVADNKKTLLIYELISEVLPLTFSTDNCKLRDSLVLRAADMILSNGISPFCSIPLLFLANSFAREYTESGFMTALEYSKLALHWADKNEKNSIVYVQTVYDLFINSLAVYFEPIADVLKYCETFSSSLLVYSRLKNIKLDSSTNAARIHLLILSGASFNAVFPSWTRNRFDIEDNSEWNRLLFNGFKLMQGSSTLEEFESLSLQYHPNPDILFASRTYKLYYLTVKNRSEEAALLVQEMINVDIPKLPLTLLHVEFYFIAGVALCQKTRGVSNSVQNEMLAEVLRRFQIFAKFSPTTFRGKYLILKALYEAHSKKISSLEVFDCFEESIEVSKANNNGYDVAWGTFLCALWLMKTGGHTKRTASFAKAAHLAFKSLNADLLVAAVEERLGSFTKEYNWAGVESIEGPLGHNNNMPLNLVLNKMFTPAVQRTRSMASREPDQPRKTMRSEQPVDLRETVKACLMISESTSQDDIIMKLLESTVMYSKVDFGAVILNNAGDACIRAIGSSNSIIPLDNEPLSSRTDLCPYALLLHVLQYGKVVNKDEDRIFFDNNFGQDEYFKSNKSDSVICIPLKNDDGIFGAVYLEKFEVSDSFAYFDSETKDLLTLLCSQAAVALAKASLYERMAVAKKAAENATAEKASFLANMSHEIRTPFNSLLSCSLFLLDTELNNTQKEYVETIKTSAMLTLNIIDGILAFSKLEHGSFTLDNAPFSINDCIESAIQIIGELASINDLDLAFFNRCPLVDTVTGDVTRFRQIIINLLGNAVKFTSKGHITVTLTSNQINENRHEFEICVEDTGVGIPQKSQNKVFGAFSQVDASSRRSFGGSGLGLAISKKLADLMGGTLTFESQEGVGTKFYLTVKAQIHEFKQPEICFSDEEAANKGTNNHALIVDSHRLGLLALQETLESLGLHVDVALEFTKIRRALNSYLIVFMDQLYFDELKRRENVPKLKCSIVLIGHFGKSLPEEVNMGTVSVMMWPFQRAKVVEIVKGIIDARPNGKLADTMAQLNVVDEDATLADQYPLRILLAEDNLINVKVALQHLKKLGYQADSAKDGVEAFEKCILAHEQNKPYQVVLMDIQMPKKDGLAATVELQEEFKARGHEQDLPYIVALTANVAGEDKQRSLDSGMVDFISKPILPEQLERVLRRLGQQVQG